MNKKIAYRKILRYINISPFIYNCLFHIFVQFYRPLHPGGSPLAVNKYHKYRVRNLGRYSYLDKTRYKRFNKTNEVSISDVSIK